MVNHLVTPRAPFPTAPISTMSDPIAGQISTLYRFCAQCLHYPQAEWMTTQFLDSLYLLLDALDAPALKDRLHLAFSASENPLEDLQIEYTRLFINGVPHVAAPPYASVYHDRSLQGPSTEKTRNFYRQHGFDIAQAGDIPDHIIYQLEFLALLTARGDESARAEFLQKIFLPWFPKFETRVRQEANHPFYSVIVQLIDYLTKEDDDDGIQLDEA